MPAAKTDLKILIQQDIKANIDWILSRGAIPPHQRSKLKKPSLVRAIATFLSEKQEFKDDDSGVNFYLLELTEIGRKTFPFVLCIPTEIDFINKRGKKTRRSECFVGCRFGSFREELTRVLEPILSYYGYKIIFGDTGFRSGQIFDTILDALSYVDFALFDNRGTETKPNVYMEVGAAYANEVPHLLLEYKKSQLPSNLTGLQSIRYSNYRELARTLSLGLPSFFESHDIYAPGQYI